jgi:hypothetical protein
MSDMKSVDRSQAAMREPKSANLNSGPAQVPCGAKQEKPVKRPTGHVEVVTGKKS